MKIQRAVLLALVIRELRVRVEGRWIGLLWMLMEPLAHVLLMLAFFGFRQRAVTTNIEYPVFLVTGLLPFFLFRNLMQRLPGTVGASRGLFSYRQVKPIDPMIARCIVETGLYGAVFVTTLLVLAWLGYHALPHSPLELVAVGAVVVALGSTMGLLLSVVFHNRPKVQVIIGWVFYPLYFISGVIFPVQSLPGEAQKWLLWNPVLHLIELSRKYFIPNYQALEGVHLLYPAACSLVVAALALSLYRVYRHHLAAAV